MTSVDEPTSVEPTTADLTRWTSRGVELLWRLGGFTCLGFVVARSEYVPNVDQKVGVFAVLAGLCFVPKLEAPSLALGAVGLGYLAQTVKMTLDLKLAWIGASLVACAGVLRVMARPPSAHGVFDRDLGALIVGWAMAMQVMSVGQLAVTSPWTMLDDESAQPFGREMLRAYRGDGKLVSGEPALLLTIAGGSALVGMLVLTAVAARRTVEQQTPEALLSHATTGFAASTLLAAFMGDLLPEVFGAKHGEYAYAGALIGGGIGAVVWMAFYSLSTNQHLRTWGGFRTFLCLWGGSVLLVTMAVSLWRLDWVAMLASAVFLAFFALLPWDTWRRIGGMRRRIQRDFEHANAMQEWLDAYIRGRRTRREGRARDGTGLVLTPDEVKLMRLNIARVRAVHEAATGESYPHQSGAGLPPWRNQSVPDLEWLHQAAAAGRWQVFLKTPTHGSALEECKKAREELTFLRASAERHHNT